MSFPTSLEEIATSALSAELNRRRNLLSRHSCPYCSQPFGLHNCKYKNREQQFTDGLELTFSFFSEINLVRCSARNGFNHEINAWSLSDWFLALLGELGEAANIGKKLNRVRDGIPGNKESPDELERDFKSEMADAFIYLDLICQSAGFRIGDVIMDVFDKKSEAIGYVCV